MSGNAVKDDPTSLGAILLRMGEISKEQLEDAIEAQERSSLEQLIGNQLVVMEICCKEQIDSALKIQKAMREGDAYTRASAVADIAIERKKRKAFAHQRMIDQSARVVRSATGQEHKAITPAMLAVPAEAK